jgi:hypothetical protein
MAPIHAADQPAPKLLALDDCIRPYPSIVPDSFMLIVVGL